MSNSATRKNSTDDRTSESETRPDSDCSSDTGDFWDGILDGRIDYIGSAPSLQQYSTTITSSTKALDKEKQALEDAIAIMRHRCAKEQWAMRNIIEALGEHLECEERAIKQSIATIHRHRNLLAPVMRLPPEILSRIFVFHAQIESNWLGAVLTSTHVCRQWWHIGQACPELWSHITYKDCHTTAWMTQMIKRSHAVPLSLTIGWAEMDARKMSLVSSNLHRFKSLNLCIPTEGADVFFEVFNQSVPLLQHLTISSFGPPTFAFPFAFPLEFLSGSAPNLRHMKLSTSSHVPWDSGLFSNLVTLEIEPTGKELNDVDPPSLDMLLSALSKMPELKTLILRHGLPPPTSATTVHAFVDLPNLKRLEVTAPLTRCTCFLQQITISASAVVLLRIGCAGISKENVEEFFTVFPSRLCAPSPPVAQALRFVWSYHNFCIDIDTWTVQRNVAFKNSQNVSIKLTFDWYSDRKRGISPLDFTWACFAGLASPQLSSFSISGNSALRWDVEVWRKVTRMVPGLQRLVPGKAVQSAALCAALRPPDGPDAVLAHCCFPSLSYLELAIPYDYPMSTANGEESPLSVALPRLLAARALIGCSTPELMLIPPRSGYPENWSEAFNNAVPGIVVHTQR